MTGLVGILKITRLQMMCILQEKQSFITEELQRKGESETSGTFKIVFHDAMHGFCLCQGLG